MADQYEGNRQAQTFARYCRTNSATTRHIINPDDQSKTLCGSRVALPEFYRGEDGAWRMAGRSYMYDLPGCVRCDKSATRRGGIVHDKRTRSVISAEAQAYAEDAGRAARPEDAGRVVDVDQARTEAHAEDAARIIAATPVNPAVEAMRKAYRGAKAGLEARPGLTEPHTGARVVPVDDVQLSTGTFRDPSAVVYLTADQMDTLARLPQPAADVPVIALIVAYGKGVAVGVFDCAEDARAWWRASFNRLRGEASLVLVPVVDEPAAEVVEPPAAPAAEVAEADEIAAVAANVHPLTGPTGSAIVAALESAWMALQRRHTDLPNVVIITGSGAKTSTWGHHWPERWIEGKPVQGASRRLAGAPAVDAGEGGGVAVTEGPTMAGPRMRRAELFISGERLACGARLTFQTLLHEAAHALAHVRDMKDTSRQGRYHNKTFVAVAESLGLHWPDGREPHKTIGFSAVELRDETAERYADVIEQLDAAISLHLALPLHMGGTVDPGDLAALPKPPRAAGGGGGRDRNNPVAVCQCPEPRKLRMARSTLEKAPVWCGECREEFRLEDAD